MAEMVVMRDRPWHPSRMRQVVLVFGSVEEAEAWDEAGQPVEIGVPVAGGFVGVAQEATATDTGSEVEGGAG